MKLLLKGFRNGLGAIIAFISWLIPVSKVKRGESEQQEVDEQTANIELYQFFGCPFCIKSRRVIRRLNLNIVTRDAQNRQGVYRAELLKETGKTQVPCLKITKGDKVEWMLETSQIIAYLEKRFG
ncbi:Glutaredoxin [uncultured Gammaproteobacteria bacterium]|jgi:glutaredoxin|uniref:Glutaredoxin n=3 Tax=sulfur-oxidizing symbionts TaxID=32036 RepID=A0A1H6LF96_9GAMM|nr:MULTISPECIES: glutaredoxin domain-containing protein [Gammaproteobacteria]CAC9425228.1 Glutaredoxin [uncultured Gammaproteobacteria bacterium]CAB5501131.1 Glutaredoxin [Bathymodiolus azoricus thioautotrophic gill symbiont]CAB5508287.1 Glutaredoxin [Bathymodiolus thermophilus thioautotrophic gill symbiont]CAC9487618.1 Glutaredoxin [uncultured Gammaproteobacteria bacterium]CAC9489623.1 Glutaredoxin [uncultured Gammaproteobacteria bacterium]